MPPYAPVKMQITNKVKIKSMRVAITQKKKAITQEKKSHKKSCMPQEAKKNKQANSLTANVT